MIKLKSTLAILSLFLVLNVGITETSYASKTPEQKKDACIEKCNEDYKGDTFFDGAQRAGCRLGCDVRYLWEIATA